MMTRSPTTPLRTVFSIEGFPPASAFSDFFAIAGAAGGIARGNRGAAVMAPAGVPAASSRSSHRRLSDGLTAAGAAVRGLGMRIDFPHPSHFTTFPIHSSVVLCTWPHWLHRHDNAIVSRSASMREVGRSLNVARDDTSDSQVRSSTRVSARPFERLNWGIPLHPAASGPFSD